MNTDLKAAATIMARQYGVTRQQFDEFVSARIRENAAKYKWRASELSMTLGDLTRVCDEVWGKK